MRRPFCVFCCAVLAALYLLLGLGAFRGKDTVLMQHSGEELALVGRVISVSRSGDRTALQLRVKRAERWNAETETQEPLTDADGAPLRIRETVLLQLSGTLNDAADLGGQEVLIWATLSLPTEKRNPGGFDYAAYLRSKRIRVTGASQAAFLHRTGRSYGPLGWAERMRQRFSGWLCVHTDSETAGVLTAMVLGDRSLLSEETEAAYQAGGLSHLMAVSGLHVTLLFGWISRLSRAPKSRGAVLRSLLLLLFYGWLCSFSPSVVRGILMIVFRKVADLLHRRYDLLTGVACSAALSGLFCPYQLVQSGFLLSYGAVLALALCLPVWESRIEPKLRIEQPPVKRFFWRFLKLIGASVSIFAAMAPLTAKLFHRLTPAAVLLNLPAIFLAGIIMPIGFVLFVLTAMLLPLFSQGAAGLQALAAVLVTAEELLLKVLSACASLGARLPVQVTAWPVFALALFYGLGLLLASEGFRMQWARHRFRQCAVLLLGTLLLCGALGLTYGDRIPRDCLVFADVGQGDCLHVHRAGQADFFIDGGGSYYGDVAENLLIPYLLDNGIRKLDGALVTHLHTDHFQGIASLCRAGMVRQLYLYEGNRPREAEVLEATGLLPEQLTYLQAGDTVWLAPDLSLEILWPAGSTAGDDEENANSLVVRVRDGALSALMTADLGNAGEEAALRYWEEQGKAAEPFSSTVLKVAHHGSQNSTSDAFLQAVHPAAAVIQVGASNNYGHPHSAILEKLTRFGIMTYRNDTCGAILFAPRKDGFAVRTVRGK